MKKAKIIILLIAGVLLLTFSLSACSTSQTDNITLNTNINLDSSNAGTRQMELIIPKNLIYDQEEQRQLDTSISINCPDDITYNKLVTNDSVKYTFLITFDSYCEYTEKLENILGFNPGVVISKPDTIFTQGVRFSENFSSKDVLSFLDTVFAMNPNLKQLDIKSNDNTVSIDGNSYTTGEYMSINNVESLQVDDINLNTVNYKNGKYDRTVIFNIPKSTMDELGNDVYSYMNARTIECTNSYWNDYLSGSKFTVEYKNIDINQLQKYTNELFGSYTCGNISYGESHDETAILNDEYNFCETLDLSGFSGENDEPVSVNYIYQTVSDGISKIFNAEMYDSGTWKDANTADDNNVSYFGKTSSLCVEIPDGYSYPLEQTNIILECLDHNEFINTIEFIYPKGEINAAEHSKNAIQNLCNNVDVNIDTTETNEICRLTMQGSLDTINSQLINIFDSYNIINYSDNTYTTNSWLHAQQTITDTINMSSLYIDDVYTMPIYYTIKTNGSETLSYVTHRGINTGDNSINVKRSNEQNITFELASANSTINFTLQQQNTIAFLIFIIIFVEIIILVIFLIIKIKKGKIKSLPKPYDDILVSTDKSEPTQKEISDILSKI